MDIGYATITPATEATRLHLRDARFVIVQLIRYGKNNIRESIMYFLLRCAKWSLPFKKNTLHQWQPFEMFGDFGRLNHHLEKKLCAWKSSANLPFGNPLGCHEPTNNYHWKLGSPWRRFAHDRLRLPTCYVLDCHCFQRKKVVEKAHHNQPEDKCYS